MPTNYSDKYTGQSTPPDPVGWMPASEAWTYASSTTFTVAGDVTTKYQKGDKIKLTQNSTVSYFYVIGVVYSAPNTTITITGGSDYSLANAAISANYFSKAVSPQGFPDWFNYLPSYSASGSMTFTGVTTEIARFKIVGKTCFVNLSAFGTTGGSADTFLYVTLPVNYAISFNGACRGFDGSITVQRLFYFAGDSNNRILVANYNFSNWGLAATKEIKAIFFYEI
jgi:hypothetical protein